MKAGLSRNSFGRGLDAVGCGRYLEALAYFEAAMQIETRSGARMPMKYLSYYGLCLAMVSNRFRQARRICEGAVRSEFFDPDLHLNLGMVYARTGDRRSAFNALLNGLRLNPRHAGLVRAIRRMGIRRPPILGFLSRANPLNRVLGHLCDRRTPRSGTIQH
jgi:tetratricopeptide (TPR) repeat protein